MWIARPSGKELFLGDFRVVRQQTAVFFDDTQTNKHMDGLKRLTLPSLAAGNTAYMFAGSKIGAIHVRQTSLLWIL